MKQRIEEKLEKYLGEAKGRPSSRVFPIPEMELQELIFDFGTEMDALNVEDMSSKEEKKVERKVMTIVRQITKAVNDPKNIKKFARAKKDWDEYGKILKRIIREYAKSIKGKHAVADSFVELTKDKRFMEELEDIMIELYKYIDELRDKEKW